MAQIGFKPEELRRLRTDQLQRLVDVGGDLNQLNDEELQGLIDAQEEIGDFGAGFKAAGAALETGIAGGLQSLGFEDTAKASLESAQRSQEELQRRYQRDVPSIIDSFGDKGVLGGLGDLPEYLKETLAFSLPQTGATLGAAGVGTLIGGPAVGVASGIAVGTPMFAGSNIQRQMEEQGIGLEDAQIAKAYGVGVGQAALDMIIGRVLGLLGPRAGVQEIAKAAQQGRLSRAVRKGGQGAAVEAGTETAQQAAEIIQANPDKFFEMSPETQKELLESAIAGGLLGGTISGTVGAVTKPSLSKLKAQDLQSHLEDEAKEASEMERNADFLTGEALGLPKPMLGLPAPGQAAIQVPPGGFQPPGVSESVGVVGRAPIDTGTTLPSVIDQPIEVPPGGFRDPSERIQESVRPEGVGRVAPEVKEAVEILEGEYIPAVQEAAEILGLPTQTIEQTIGLPRGTGAIIGEGPTLSPGEVATGRRDVREVVRPPVIRVPPGGFDEQGEVADPEGLAIPTPSTIGIINPFVDQKVVDLIDKIQLTESVEQDVAVDKPKMNLISKYEKETNTLDELETGAYIALREAGFSENDAKNYVYGASTNVVDNYESAVQDDVNLGLTPNSELEYMTASMPDEAGDAVYKFFSKRDLTNPEAGEINEALSSEAVDEVTRPRDTITIQEREQLKAVVPEGTGSDVVKDFESMVYGMGLSKEQAFAKIQEIIADMPNQTGRLRGLGLRTNNEQAYMFAKLEVAPEVNQKTAARFDAEQERRKKYGKPLSSTSWIGTRTEAGAQVKDMFEGDILEEKILGKYEVYKRKSAFGIKFTVVDLDGNAIELERDPNAPKELAYTAEVKEGGRFSGQTRGSVETIPAANKDEAILWAVDAFETGFFVPEQERVTEKRRVVAKKERGQLRERLKQLGLPLDRIKKIVDASPKGLNYAKSYSVKRKKATVDSIRETAKQYADPQKKAQYAQMSERVRKILAKRLRELGLKDVALRFESVIRTPTGELAEGVQEQDAAGNILIALSNAIYDPNISEKELTEKIGEVMNHEMIHAMKNLGLFTNEEYQALVKATKDQKYTDRRGKTRLFTYFERAQQLYAGDSEAVQEEEAVAELFRDWAAGRKKIGGKPASLFKRIIKFITSLGRSVREEPDVKSIFEAIESGQIGRRERAVAPDGDTVSYSRKGTPEIGINVRYDAGAGIDYAEEIVSGRKTLETRNTDSLKPYIGRRVGIVRTGLGPAEAIGSVVVGRPIVTDQAGFDRTRDQHLVPKGSTFDIEAGGTKFMYPMQDPEVFDEPVAVDRGIVARRLKGATAPSATAEDSGIDDTKGTKKFSKKVSADQWVKDSVVTDPVFHATLDAFPAFDTAFADIGFHFGMNQQARDRLEEKSKASEYSEGVLFPRLIQALINMKRPLAIAIDPIDWRDPEAVMASIFRGARDPLDNQRDRSEDIENIVGPEPTIEEIRDAIISLGFDGIAYINAVEGEAKTFLGTDNLSYIVFSPDQIYIESVTDLPMDSVENLKGRADMRDQFDPAQMKLGPQPKFSRKFQFPKAETNPFNTDLTRTALPYYPEQYIDRRKVDGKMQDVVAYKLTGDEQFKPNKTPLLEAARWLYNKTAQSLGTTDPVPYTDENAEELAGLMATEALKALEYDNNAIGWYDEQITTAKKILSVVEPEIFATPENEVIFDWALAVTSNGQAVSDNFNHALEVFRFYKANGRLPVKEWKKGGKRTNAMRASFQFANEYNDMLGRGEVEESFGDFLDREFTVKELQEVVREMNEEFGSDIEVPSGELVGTTVNGSFIAGPKIGQGFYQNLRGNFEPLTMDIWWMRMWNRLVNRPFEPETSPQVIRQKRTAIRQEIAESQDPVIQQVVTDALSKTGLTRSDLRKNETFDSFVPALRMSWDRYFRAYQKQNKKNPKKPQLFNTVGTLETDIYGKMQATPTNGTERNFMRQVVARARQLLAEQGVDINTADMQALLWYPEKRLFEALGVPKGAGQDTDYAESARLTAKKEGVSDEQIQEALSDPRSGRVDSGADSRGPVSGSDQEAIAERKFSLRGTRNAARRIAADAGPDGRIWNVTRKGGSLRQVPVVAEYKLNDTATDSYGKAGISTPTIVELEKGPGAARIFNEAIEQAKQSTQYGPAVYIYKPEEYAEMRLFMTQDGQAGFALKDGDVTDIVSVFSNSNSGYKAVSFPLMRLAYEMGGRKLDAFDTVLPYIYSANGFRVASRIKWNEEFAPEGWDKELFSEFNNGEPDVVFMAFDSRDTKYRRGEGVTFDTGDAEADFERAMTAQENIARRFSKKFSGKGATAPSGYSSQTQAILDRLVDMEPTQNPIMKWIDKNVLGRVEGETRMQAFTRNGINKFLPGYLLDDYVNGEITDPANSVGRAMELSQNMTGRVWAISELGALRFNKETGLPEVLDASDNMGLNEIFEPIGEKLEKEFLEYGILRRQIRLGSKGRKGFKNVGQKEAIQAVGEIEARHPQFKEVHKNYQKFNDRMISFAMDAGLIDQEMADNFRDMDYVPFYRMSETTNDPSEMSKAMAAKAYASLKDPNVFEKELEGGTQKIGNLYENVSNNATMIVSAALKNYAMQKTADALDAAEKKGGVKSWGRKAVEGETGQIITFFRDGKKVKYKIDDAALWTAVAGLTAKQKESWIQALETVGGILRSGVTLMPGFQLANLWRGKLDAYIKTGIPIYSFDKTIKGMADVYRGADKDVTNFKLMSGMGGFLYGADNEALAKTMRRNYRLKDKGGPVMQQISDRMMQGVKELERTGEASEMAERIAIMRRLMDQGMSEKEAVFQGLNLINFGRRGAGGGAVMSTLVNFLIPTVPFLNARIQGLARLVEDPSQPGALRTTAFKEMAGRGLIITAASTTAALLAMQDEDRWENETVTEKVTNDIIYIGDYKLRIPKAFEVGALFGTIPVMTIDAIRQESGRDLATAVGHIFSQTFSFNPVPQGVLPALEVLANYDSFRGAPIEGISLQALPTEERFYESTPEIYKFMSSIGLARLGLSPLEIQQLIEGYTGTMGSQFFALTDTLAGATGVIEEKPAGVFGNPFARTFMQVAGLDRFVREDGQGASRFVSDFYEMRRSMEQTYRSANEAAQRGLVDTVEEIYAEKGVSLGLRKQFNRVARTITEINRAIDQVRFSDIPASEKKERLKALRKQKVTLTAQMVRMAKNAGYYDQ